MIPLALLLTALLGWLLVRPVAAGIPACPSLALGFLTGAAALSLQLLLYNLAHIPWNRWTILLPWLALVAARAPRPRVSASPRLPGWLELPGLLFAAAVLLAWLPYERLMPLNEWDAVMLWMFKGKAFYLDRGIAPYLARAGDFLANPAYPLLVPLYATFLYLWARSEERRVGKECRL